MPIYDYQCVDCGGRDQRVAGIDDHTSLCVECGGLMLRLNEDVFQPYFPPGWDEEQFRRILEAEEAVPPAGCDGLCRIDCEAYKPQSVYCLEQGE